MPHVQEALVGLEHHGGERQRGEGYEAAGGEANGGGGRLGRRCGRRVVCTVHRTEERQREVLKLRPNE